MSEREKGEGRGEGKGGGGDHRQVWLDEGVMGD